MMRHLQGIRSRWAICSRLRWESWGCGVSAWCTTPPGFPPETTTNSHRLRIPCRCLIIILGSIFLISLIIILCSILLISLIIILGSIILISLIIIILFINLLLIIYSSSQA